MTLLSLHCRNSEALRCSILQTGSVVYGSLSVTSFESVINQSELCVQILDACMHVNIIGTSLSPGEPARRLANYMLVQGQRGSNYVLYKLYVKQRHGCRQTGLYIVCRPITVPAQNWVSYCW